MSMMMNQKPTSKALWAGLLLACLSSCSPQPGVELHTPADGGADAGGSTTLPAVLPAATYCETIAEHYCRFYLRCGRMAVDDEATCRAVFAESCEAKYEPQYVSYEAAGLLQLSGAGVSACLAHLDEVACDDMLHDLDGPCRNMWVGTQPVGGDCGIDIANLACQPEAICVVDLSLCGTCRATAEDGGACDDTTRCQVGSSCVDGTCVARARPREPCHPQAGCVLGSRCIDNVCSSPDVRGVGEACGGSARCAYRAACVDGTCVEAALLGEACALARPCATGRCESGVCTTLAAPLEPCGAPTDCRSGVCADGICGEVVSACFAE